jgi:hypothetical protein
MKNLLLFLSSISFLICKSQLNISIVNTSGSNTITCYTPTIQLSGTSTYTTAPVVYVWNTPTGTVIGNSLSVTTPGIYTLAASVGTLSAFQVITIGVNTVVPTSFISPTFQNISCNLFTITNFTLVAITPSTSVTHNIIAPSLGVYSANTPTSAYSPQSAGTYTYVLSDDSNGCKTTKTATVNSSQGFPTYTLNSPQNYTLGCSSKSVAIINILNANTIPSGGPVSYTLLNPGSSTITSNSTLSIFSIYSVTIPGTYTIVVRDNISLCESRTPVSILQNTAGPPLSSLISPTNILSCDQPSVQLIASSTTNSVNFVWTYPTGTIVSNSLTVSNNLNAPTATLINNYTLSLTDPVNLCKTFTVVSMYQNVFAPKAKINAITNVLTCNTPTIFLVNASSTNIPPGSFFNSLPVIGFNWAGPSPQLPVSMSSTYVAAAAGVYTLTAKDLNNGCTSNTTSVISDNIVYPAVSIPNQFTIACPSGVVNLVTSISGNTASFTYSWTVPANALVTGITSSVLSTNAQGSYSLAVLNTVNGCKTLVSFDVWGCVGINEQTTLSNNILISPNPGNGWFDVSIKNTTKNASIKVLTTLGEVILETPLNSENSSIDLRYKASGLYFVYFFQDKKTVSITKVIKQ